MMTGLNPKLSIVEQLSDLLGGSQTRTTVGTVVVPQRLFGDIQVNRIIIVKLRTVNLKIIYRKVASLWGEVKRKFGCNAASKYEYKNKFNFYKRRLSVCAKIKIQWICTF